MIMVVCLVENLLVGKFGKKNLVFSLVRQAVTTRLLRQEVLNTSIEKIVIFLMAYFNMNDKTCKRE